MDLRKFSIKDAWMSEEFENFRTYFKKACPNCTSRMQCMGGCPICPEIVLCDKKHFDNNPLSEKITRRLT